VFVFVYLSVCVCACARAYVRVHGFRRAPCQRLGVCWQCWRHWLLFCCWG
jgi:hypothetical protein